MADNARSILLTMKKHAGTATAAELAELRDAWVLTGDGPKYLCAPVPCATMEDFMAKFGDMQHPTLPGQEPPEGETE